MINNFNEKVNFIWSVADLMRGPYWPNQYKDVMLPRSPEQASAESGVRANSC